MQASKHSKKTSQSNGGGAAGQRLVNKEKSIAQRVMDVSLPDPPKEIDESSADLVYQIVNYDSQTTKPILKSSASYNSVENNNEAAQNDTNAGKKVTCSGEIDHDSPAMMQPKKPNAPAVEREAKHQGKENNISANSNGNDNTLTIKETNNANDLQLQFAKAESQETLINLENTNKSQIHQTETECEQRSPNSISTDTNENRSNMFAQSPRMKKDSKNDQLISCQSVFKQVINKNMQPPVSNTDLERPNQRMVSVGSSNCVRSTRISLETRVPHPLATRNNGFHSEEEEVSYLNLGVHNLNNRAACSSLDNTTKPMLLAAAREQRFGLQAKTAASCHQLRPKPIQLQQHNISRRQSVTSNHEYEGMSPEYDEFPRYDNAQVEENIKQKQPTSNNCKLVPQNNNNETGTADDIYDCSNEKTVMHQQSSHGSSTSIPASPKTKSAPATPCNMTPTAFHQHNPNSRGSPRGATIGGQICLGTNNAKNSRRSVINNIHQAGVSNDDQVLKPQDLADLIETGERALENKDYQSAIIAFNHCIRLAANNLDIDSLKELFQVYGKRAEVNLKLQNFKDALDDSMAARELNPKWTQAYYLQGRAHFLIGEQAESLAAFAYGLALDPSNNEMFDAIVDTALLSSYKEELEPKFETLKSLNLDKKPFVVVAMLGQEMLAAGKYEPAALILESALKLGKNEDKRMRTSVLSTIALAFCKLKDYKKATINMNEEYKIERELEDVGGQIRVLSNLGFTYFKWGKLDESLEAHRKQLSLAMKGNLYHEASLAFNAIGHVHAARNDYQGALTSHTRCLDILRQLADNDFAQFKELLSVGHVCLMMNDLKSAEERFNDAIQLLDSSQPKLSSDDYRIGLIMHRFNMAHLSLKKQCYKEAADYFHEVMRRAKELKDTNPRLATMYEVRACNGLGHTFKFSKRPAEFAEYARGWFKRQSQLASQIPNSDIRRQLMTTAAE